MKNKTIRYLTPAIIAIGTTAAAMTTAPTTGSTSSGSTSSATSANAPVPPPPVLTRTNAIMSTPQLQRPTIASLRDMLCQNLVYCTTALPRERELTGQQLNTLYWLVNTPGNLAIIDPNALSEAFTRIDDNNWFLARILLLMPGLNFHYHNDQNGNVKDCTFSSSIQPYTKLSGSYINRTFAPDCVTQALYEAGQKNLGLIINQMMQNRLLVALLSTDTINDFFLIAATQWKNEAIVGIFIHHTEILAKLTYTTFHTIFDTAPSNIIALMNKNPYINKIMSTDRVLIKPIAQQHATLLKDESATEDDTEVAMIMVDQTARILTDQAADEEIIHRCSSAPTQDGEPNVEFWAIHKERAKSSQT